MWQAKPFAESIARGRARAAIPAADCVRGAPGVLRRNFDTERLDAILNPRTVMAPGTRFPVDLREGFFRLQTAVCPLVLAALLIADCGSGLHMPFIAQH
jgi:hypothetical protein